MKLEIITVLNDRKQILQQSCKPVKSAKEFEPFIDDMRELLRTSRNGFGLAAPQVGISKRFFILRTGADRYEIIVNPTVVSTSKETIRITEECLSIPQLFKINNRPKQVEIKYLDERMLERRARFHDFQAAVILHEIEHLEGKLICSPEVVKTAEKAG